MSALLPSKLYSVAEVRALDAAAIASGIPGLTLMQRAGQAGWAMLLRRWPQAVHVAVICGSGNNGGDGYVLASAARRAGRRVTLLEVGDSGKAGAEAQACRAAALADGVMPGGGLAALATADVLVDALFGIGLRTAPAGEFAATIEAINESPAPVLSLDVPSGLDADTGYAPGKVVRATATLTFIGLKQGLFTGEAADCLGALEFDDLEVPAEVYDVATPAGDRLVPGLVRGWLAPRRRTAHKGDAGHVLVVGGTPGYVGAARMAAEAALRTGAGLVSVAAPEAVTAGLAAGRPELMVHAVESPADLGPLLARVSVVAIGPGLGQGAWGHAMLGAVLQRRLPLVVDADALNLLAGEPLRREGWCLTPHPGEAGRLLGLPTAKVNADRFSAARALAERFGGTVLLKGAGTVVTEGQAVDVVCAGNPGMASGGMGDVLTGIIAGLVAQGMPLPQAARLGAVLHASAADRAALAGGERGLLATDLFPPLRQLLNES